MCKFSTVIAPCALYGIPVDFKRFKQKVAKHLIFVFVCKIYRKSYRGTNFSEFARIIQEEYGVQASRSTIYNFLRKGRIRSPQRKAKKRKVISYDDQGNKIIQIVRVYDRKTTNNPSGKKVIASTTIKPARKPATTAAKTTKKTTTKKTTKK